jgi:hypothetical protein
MQIHSFDPGDLNEPGQPNHFTDGGIFWTGPIPKTSVRLIPGQGGASLTLSDAPLFDFVTGLNTIFRDDSAPIIDATASLEIHWTGTGEQRCVQNDPAGFGGSYEHATATVEWSASNAAGYFFRTINSSETNVTHAFTANVRNGIFHP